MSDWTEWGKTVRGPLLVVSTRVGRGMYFLGEAIIQQLPKNLQITHIAIEDFVGKSTVQEDLNRYQWISTHTPWALNLVYRIPIFYWRKRFREQYLWSANLSKLKNLLNQGNFSTCLAISHRPAFWLASLKRRAACDWKLWGVLGEYGRNLGWHYQFWNEFDGFISPLPISALRIPIPKTCETRQFPLPARKEFEALSGTKGQPFHILLVAGYWGQNSFLSTVRATLQSDARIRMTIVCGENENRKHRLQRHFHKEVQSGRVRLFGAIPHLAPLLSEATAVVTKPGISTVLETVASGRKLFLLKGMPVAEDNNARWAIENFGASRFDSNSIQKWVEAQPQA